jgi:outer membrane PBP1 activator LpoA protein
MNYGEKNRALKLLQTEAYKDDYFKDLLAEFYAAQKNYTYAARTYLELFYKAQDDTSKEHYLKKTLEALVAAKDTQQAVHLAKKYESGFINNPQMRQFILRLYLSAQQLDAAAELSQKILKAKYRK